MTARETEQIEAMYAHYNHRCFVCNAKATQRAHILGRTRSNIKHYGNKIINHPFNWMPACSLACNALLDAGNNLQMKETVASIILNTALHPEIQRAMIEQAVKINVARKQDKIYD